MLRFLILFLALLTLPAHAATRGVRLTAADGVRVFGVYMAPAQPKALILLFHQAGSSSDEYETIAPRLAALGYASLAIDQRSGGPLFGDNLTVDALGSSRSYVEARRDLEAALRWAMRRPVPIVLWGSSYSSSLVLLLAADRPSSVAAVLSFSPGEYLGNRAVVAQAAMKIRAPTFIFAAPTEEAKAARPIFAALPGPGHVFFVPKAGVHGSSTLISARNPKGAEENWRAVTAFLQAHVR